MLVQQDELPCWARCESHSAKRRGKLLILGSLPQKVKSLCPPLLALCKSQFHAYPPATDPLPPADDTPARTSHPPPRPHRHMKGEQIQLGPRALCCLLQFTVSEVQGRMNLTVKTKKNLFLQEKMLKRAPRLEVHVRVALVDAGHAVLAPVRLGRRQQHLQLRDALVQPAGGEGGSYIS